MDYLLAIVALSLLIIVHEFGHYICAVATGMKVDRFSVFGIGPVVVRLFTWRGTEFVLSAIPFGAYVHIVGMEADDQTSVAEGGRPGEVAAVDPKDPTLYRNRPIWARMLAILGGPAANYLAAMLIVFALVGFVGSAISMSMKVDNVIEPAAATAGLMAGDELVSIAGTAIQGELVGDKYIPAEERVYSATEAHKGQTVPIVVNRGGERLTLDVPLTDQGKIGIEMSALTTHQFTVPIGTAALTAAKWPIDKSVQQLTTLKRWITGEISGKMSGPVGIVKTMARSTEQGLSSFLVMAAFISAMLGMFNLLPLPALDGGRFVFLLWEGVTRRPANRTVEEMVHGYGMLALLGLILYVTFVNDI